MAARKSNEEDVTTELAYLSDALGTDYTFDVEKQWNICIPVSVDSVASIPGASISGQVCPHFHVWIHGTNRGHTYLGVMAQVTGQTDLTLRFSQNVPGDVSRTLASIPGPFINIPIFGIPIVLDSSFDLSASGGATGAFALTMHAALTGTVCAIYDSNYSSQNGDFGWSWPTGNNCAIPYGGQTLTGTAWTPRVWVDQLQGSFDGDLSVVAGPHLLLGIGTKGVNGGVDFAFNAFAQLGKLPCGGFVDASGGLKLTLSLSVNFLNGWSYSPVSRDVVVAAKYLLDHLGAPCNLVASVASGGPLDGQEKIALQWESGSATEEGFRVHVKLVGLGTITTQTQDVRDSQNSTTFTVMADGGVLPAVLCFSVTAFKGVPQSTESNTFVLPDAKDSCSGNPPNAPTGLQAMPADQTHIGLSWHNPDTAIGDNIYEGSKYVDTVALGTTTYTVSGLAPQSRHCYTVVAFDIGAKPSKPSDQACATTRASFLPGGTWENPKLDNQPFYSTITLSAHAYPSHNGDPAIGHVEFTAWWSALGPNQPGNWKHLCSPTSPQSGDLYACSTNLGQLGAPAGPVMVSFDVYDQQGNKNLAPNGEHVINYSPDVPCGALTSGPLPPGCPPATITTSKNQYLLGESPQLCYSVPGPYHVRITVRRPDGSTTTALEINDDGHGGCFSPGPAGPPLGLRNVHLEVSVNNSVLATADTTYTVVSPCSVRSGACATISTDKSQYTPGQDLKICYQVPGPYHITISLTKPDGSTSIVADADDDGNGGCIVPGMVGTPPGDRQLHLDVSLGGYIFATADTTYTVLADTTERIDVNPSSGPGGSMVTVRWNDDADDTSPATGTVYFDDQSIATFSTNDGAWSGQVQIPQTASIGAHTISISDGDNSSQSTAFTVTGCTSTTTCGGSGATLTTSQSTFQVGDTLTICYTVPQPAHVTITISRPDGSQSTVLDGDDDGHGGCFSPGAVGPPSGLRRVHMDVTVGGAVIATADTSYTVA